MAAGLITPIKLAVFGDPVAHSLSPRIHTQFGEYTGIAVDYQAIHAGVDELIDSLADFRHQGGQGANLTVPHKQASLDVCATFSERARASGAVNTLIRTDAGWHGDNTDGAGLLWDLQRLSVPLNAGRILIIGAGGATRGIIPALLQLNPAEIIIANRTLGKAEQLAVSYDPFPVTACYLDHIADLDDIDLLIHASSAGHNGGLTLPPLHGAVSPHCYDLSYGQAAQWFIDWARTHGYAASDGLGMLVGQAAEAFQLWTGADINDQQRGKVLAKLQ